MRILRGAIGLAKAATGIGTVPVAVARARITHCNLCPNRSGDRCTLCGCKLPQKAMVQSESCPRGLW